MAQRSLETCCERSVNIMRADVRRRIQQALAEVNGGEVNSTFPGLNDAIEQALSGEREFSIEEIARKHGLTYHTVYRAVKGKPGYRVYGKRCGAKVPKLFIALS
jgi:hypothetical protein